MKLPQGISVVLFNSNTENRIEPDQDGYLGTAESMDLEYYDEIYEADENPDTPPRHHKILLEMQITRQEEFVVFVVNQPKDVNPVLNVREYALPDDPATEAPEGTSIYRIYIPVKTTRDGTVTTKFPTNSIRFLLPLGNGWFQMWRISVVSQEGNFFLVSETVFEPFRCYRADTNVACPLFTATDEEERRDWPAFMTLINRVITGDAFMELPPLSEKAKDPEPMKPEEEEKDLPIGQGRCVWFSQAEQYGMLATKHGNARIHWQNLDPRPDSRRRHLNSGELVEIAQLTQPVEGKRRTDFTQEAIGVRLI